MSTNFPGAVDSYTVKVDGVDDVMASHVNNLQDAVVAIETVVIAQSPNPNLLADTLTYDFFPQGETLNDCPDSFLVTPGWRLLWGGNAPDLSTTQPATAINNTYKPIKCLFDTNGSQAGFVTFLSNRDTVRLRGKTLSFSIDVEGFNVLNMRAAILGWSGTADAYTIDVVATWATGNPTLATNWAYLGTTPVSQSTTGDPARIKAEGVTLANDTTYTNLALFVWTPDSENSTDYFALARAKLEIGLTATAFVNQDYQQEADRLGQVVQPDNIFINGGFDFWQRTTNDTAVSAGTRKYVADRWGVKPSGATLGNVQRSTTVRTNARAKYSLQLDGAASVTTVEISQRIEAAMVGRYKGPVAFSGYIYNGSGADFTPTLKARTPSAADNFTTTTVRNGGGSGEILQRCIDGQWTWVTWTADVSGYTDINNGLEIEITIPSGSLVAGDVVRLAEFNLVPGAVAMPFAARPIGHEQDLCKRYFQYLGRGLSGAATLTTRVGVSGQFVPQMRGTPTLALTTTSPVIRADFAGNVTGSGSALDNTFVDSYGLATEITGFTGLTDQDPCAISTVNVLSADAEL